MTNGQPVRSWHAFRNVTQHHSQSNASLLSFNYCMSSYPATETRLSARCVRKITPFIAAGAMKSPASNRSTIHSGTIEFLVKPLNVIQRSKCDKYSGSVGSVSLSRAIFIS